jgi:hypothetical protein
VDTTETVQRLIAELRQIAPTSPERTKVAEHPGGAYTVTATHAGWHALAMASLEMMLPEQSRPSDARRRIKELLPDLDVTFGKLKDAPPPPTRRSRLRRKFDDVVVPATTIFGVLGLALTGLIWIVWSIIEFAQSP